MPSYLYEVMQVERWYKVDNPEWSIVEYADKQEFMFVQDHLLAEQYNDKETDDREVWKGPNQDG